MWYHFELLEPKTMEIRQELDIIKQIRGEVHYRKELTGENLFLAWGYPTAIVLFIEFLALQLWHENWCEWLWLGIPLVGTPLMIYFLNEDYERTGCRTLEQNVILMMWIFVGFASCVGGVSMGLAGIFPQCYCAYQSLLVGFGCFMTGMILQFTSGLGNCSLPPSLPSLPSSSPATCFAGISGITIRLIYKIRGLYYESI